MSTPTAKITEFQLGKGISSAAGKDGPWTKKYLEVKVRMPEQYTPKDLDEAMLAAEYIIDNRLGAPETPQIPDVDTNLLMNHPGWKAKKKGDGSYAQGSLVWGWDFADKFPPEIINALQKGPVEIDKYVFSLNKEQTLVSVKEKRA